MVTSRSIIILIAVSFVCESAYSQANLIKNAGFEDFEDCRTHGTIVDGKYLCDDWFLPWGTSDLFSTCARGEVSVPSNFMGVQAPRSGEAYMGTIAGHKVGCGSELVENEMDRPLEAGKTYIFTMYVSLSEGSYFQLNYLEATFSDEKIKSKKKLVKNPPDIVFHNPDALSQAEDWARLSAIYKARGGERYLVIGNYHCEDINQAGTDNEKFSSRYAGFKDCAYYYIDDVSLFELPENEVSVANTEEVLKVFAEENIDTVVLPEKVFILKNIEFETGSNKLKPESFPELDSLAEKLINHPSLFIEIRGHTDDEGSESSNLVLSLSRAEAVAEYLISKGVNEMRLEKKGLGETQPIYDNITERGRAKNRRVEIKILD